MTSPTEAPRILLVRRKAVGDVVTSLAVARALRRRWPRARMEIVVDRPIAPLVERAALFDEVQVYDPPKGRGRLVHDLRWMWHLRRRRYDMVLDLMGTPSTAAWSRLSGARLRVGRRRRGRSWAYNLLLPGRGRPVRFSGEDFLDFARVVGAPSQSWRPFPLLGASPGGVEPPPPEGKGPWVIIHAPASWSAKAWPNGHWGELIRCLHDHGIERIEVSWGPGEEKTRDAVLEGADGGAVAMPALGLVELTRRLGACDLLIAIDSGPVHLAVGEGTPTLTLFGSTDPRGWHPPVEGHRFLVHDVPCRPCNLTVCPVEGHPCLDAIEAEEVCAVALEMLEGSMERRA